MGPASTRGAAPKEMDGKLFILLICWMLTRTLTIDGFGGTRHRYNPMGKKDLRTVFMKTKNEINGRFFAELHRDVTFKRVAECKSQAAIEPRISIYGNDPEEWANLAKWFCKFKVACVDPVTGRDLGKMRWIVQIPRLCQIFMGKTYVDNVNNIKSHE